MRDVQVLEAVLSFFEKLPRQQVKRVMKLLARMR
jgi:hypothetical protein